MYIPYKKVINNSTQSNSTLQVQDYNYTVQDYINYELSNSFWKNMLTNNLGVVTIKFTEDLMIPDHIEYINKTVLNIKLLPTGSVDDKYYNFTWETIEY